MTAKAAIDTLCQWISELRSAEPSRTLLGSSLMHPRHPIPNEQQEIVHLLQNESFSTASIPARRFLTRTVACLLFSVYESMYLFILKAFWQKTLQRVSPRKVDVLLKTYCTSIDHLNKSSDFYFGSLRPDLMREGVTTVFLCGDGRSDGGTLLSKLRHARYVWSLTKRMLQQRPFRYIPEWLLIPSAQPLKASFEQITLAVRLLRTAQSRHPNQALFARFVAFDLLRPFTGRNLAHFDIARKAVARWSPAAVITLYEGHPWETLAWLGARSASKDCRIIGYQHTILLRHTTNVTRRLPQMQQFTAPNIVLCTGKTTEAMLRPGHSLLQTQLIPFGSYRRNSNSAQPARPSPERKTVMVLPEGNLPESVRIFNFALRLATRLPDHHFIFRCHPMLPFENVQGHLDRSADQLSNVEISKRELIADDFSRSSAILYRGSSAVLYGVLHGLKSIYLKDQSSYDMDPLYELSCWRNFAASPEEAAACLVQYAESKPEELQAEWEKAATYVQDYTQAVDERSLRQLMAIIPSRSKGKAA